MENRPCLVKLGKIKGTKPRVTCRVRVPVKPICGLGPETKSQPQGSQEQPMEFHTKVMDEVEVAVPSICYCCFLHVLPLCTGTLKSPGRSPLTLISNGKGVKSFTDNCRYRILGFLVCNRQGKETTTLQFHRFLYFLVYMN